MELFFHITYSGAGGMTEAVLTLLEAAQRQVDVRHHLLFYGTDSLPERTCERCQRMGVDYTMIPKGPGNDWRSLVRIAATLRHLKPDVVCSHMTQPLPALLRYRFRHPASRIISIEHHSNALKSSKDWLLTCANHALTDHTVYLTPQYRDEIRHRLRWLYREGRTSVIPNGIDTDRFRPSPRVSSNGFLIGMTARMVPGKDFATLLRAFQIVLAQRPAHRLRLQLAGDGPQREELFDLTRELGIARAVDFLGEVSQGQLIPTMQGWQVFVLSTLGETMSRSIMEAQSIGLPILSTLVPGVSAAIEPNRTGLLVPPEDSASMAEALLALVDSASLRDELGRNAREKALRDYSAEGAWGRYYQLTRYLISH